MKLHTLKASSDRIVRIVLDLLYFFCPLFNSPCLCYSQTLFSISRHSPKLIIKSSIPLKIISTSLPHNLININVSNKTSNGSSSNSSSKKNRPLLLSLLPSLSFLPRGLGRFGFASRFLLSCLWFHATGFLLTSFSLTAGN